jgi:hypothetical protein
MMAARKGEPLGFLFGISDLLSFGKEPTSEVFVALLRCCFGATLTTPFSE